MTGKVELKGGESPFSFLFGLRKLTPDQRHGDNATTRVRSSSAGNGIALSSVASGMD
jgi:hypothetical protein